MRKNKAEKLQTLWDASGTLMEAEIKFRGRLGWWVIPDEARHWGDDGDYLGRDYTEAETAIRKLDSSY